MFKNMLKRLIKVILMPSDLDFLVDENCKYSNFLGDLIVQLEKY